jgi:predicted ferric reductase
MAWVRVIKPFILLRKEYEVKRIIPERGNAYTIVLESIKHPRFRFQPGQFAWITIWDSPFRDHEHPFSISSSAHQDAELTFTIKELGDFTSKIKNIAEGQRVYVDGPYGSFSIDRHPMAKEYIFIAGGVGITPVMSMLRTMSDRGDSRPVTLLYANKILETATFLEEIEKLPGKMNLKVIHVVEKPAEGWMGESGFINADVLRRHLPAEVNPNHTEIFVCGPVPMMNAVEHALIELGIPAGDYHSERFDLV